METVNLAGSTFFYKDDTPCLKIKQERYELGEESFDTLLNLLKIPTKYLHRFASEDVEQASANVNFWLSKKQDDISLAVRGNEVISVIEADIPVVHAQTVFDALEKYLGAKPFITQEGELHVALFRAPIPEIQLLTGEIAFISIRLTYSECFSITPRVDAVLTVKGSFENYYMAVQQRKFRVLGMTDTQIINEVIEFTDVVTEQMQKLFVPALEKMMSYDAKLNIYGFVDRLCSELRFSKKICRALLSGIEGPEQSLHLLVRMISNNLLPEVRDDGIDFMMARDIEIALSKAIMTGRFK